MINLVPMLDLNYELDIRLLCCKLINNLLDTTLLD